MKLVIMTKSTFFVEEDKILTALFDEGMDDLHLFKPDSSPLFSERLLTLLSDEECRKITVHEHYYLKSEYRLAGIHIDQMDAEAPKGYRGHISQLHQYCSAERDEEKSKLCVSAKHLQQQVNSQPTIHIHDEPTRRSSLARAHRPQSLCAWRDGYRCHPHGARTGIRRRSHQR